MLKNTPAILPPHYFVASILAMLALSFWLGEPGFNAWQLSGLAFVAIGVAIAVLGSRAFARAQTNIIPLQPASTLVTSGVFTVSRNPMYLGMLLALSGLAGLLGEPWNLAIVGAFFLVIRLAFVPAEEAQMIRTFGQAYADYCQRVRRWL